MLNNVVTYYFCALNSVLSNASRTAGASTAAKNEMAKAIVGMRARHCMSGVQSVAIRREDRYHERWAMVLRAFAVIVFAASRGSHVL